MTHQKVIYRDASLYINQNRSSDRSNVERTSFFFFSFLVAASLGDDGVVGNLDVWTHGEITHPLKHKKYPYGEPRNPNSW